MAGNRRREGLRVSSPELAVFSVSLRFTGAPRVRRRRALAIALLLCSIALPSRTRAQELRGTVVHADGVTAASGIVVLLRAGAADSIVARTVTGERGNFALRAGRPSTVRLQLLRLGHRPMLAGTFALEANESRTIGITLVDAPILLANLDVRAANRCEVRPDGSQLVAQLFEEARKALLASTSSMSGVSAIATFTGYNRVQNIDGELLLPVQRTVKTGPTTRPFIGMHPDTLARLGYLTKERDGTTTYRAPDADVLLSDAFVTRHCLHLVEGTGARAGWIGIGFRPVKRERNVVDLRGTLWLDRATTQLQRVEFTYDGLPSDHQRAGVGGEVEFTRTSLGFWFVNQWAIRMPRIAMQQMNAGLSVNGAMPMVRTFIEGLEIAGGYVQQVSANGQTIYASSDNPARDTVPFHQPAAAAALPTCGERAESVRDAGMVYGTVLDRAKQPVAVDVTASWREEFRSVGETGWAWRVRELSTNSSPSGVFSLCGVPLDRLLSLTARREKGGSTTASVRVSRAKPVVAVDLVLDQESRPPQ